MMTEEEHYGTKVDMWSCGCVLLRLLTTQEDFFSLWMSAYNHKYLDNKAEFKKQIQLRCDHLMDHLKSLESRDEDLESVFESLLSVPRDDRKWFEKPSAPSPKATESPLANVAKRFFAREDSTDPENQLFDRLPVEDTKSGYVNPRHSYVNPKQFSLQFSGKHGKPSDEATTGGASFPAVLKKQPSLSKGTLEGDLKRMGARRSFDTSQGVGLEAATSGGK